jgi:hypothetical protein
MDDESASSDSEPTLISKVKLRIPPKTTSRTANTSKKSKAPDNDKNDKTYAPAKRPRQRSESPVPSFELDEDGHEIMEESSAPRAPVSYLALVSQIVELTEDYAQRKRKRNVVISDEDMSDNEMVANKVGP